MNFEKRKFLNCWIYIKQGENGEPIDFVEDSDKCICKYCTPPTYIQIRSEDLESTSPIHIEIGTPNPDVNLQILADN